MALWQHLHVLQSSLQKLNFIFDLRFAWVLRSCDMLIAADWTFPALVERGLILSRNSRGEHTIGAFAFAERGLSWSSRFCLRHSWQRSPCALRRFVCLPMNLIACVLRAPMDVSVRSAYVRNWFELTSCSSRAGGLAGLRLACPLLIGSCFFANGGRFDHQIVLRGRKRHHSQWGRSVGACRRSPTLADVRRRLSPFAMLAMGCDSRFRGGVAVLFCFARVVAIQWCRLKTLQ